METAIIVALITGAFSFLGTWMVTRSESRKAEERRTRAEQDAAVKQAAEKATLEARLNSIDRKLDEHNGYARKLADVTQALISIQKDIEYLKKGRA